MMALLDLEMFQKDAVFDTWGGIASAWIIPGTEYPAAGSPARQPLWSVENHVSAGNRTAKFTRYWNLSSGSGRSEKCGISFSENIPWAL
jgi:hypothetical protein